MRAAGLVFFATLIMHSVHHNDKKKWEMKDEKSRKSRKTESEK